MEQIEIIQSLSGTCLGLILTVITFFLKSHSSAKNKKKIQNALKLTNVLLPWIQEAEQFLNYTGEEKKEYVITKASRYALENKIEFKEEEIKEKIEDLVSFSRKVNHKQSITKKYMEETK